MAYNILKHRRGTTQEWLSIDLVPEDGELVIEECSNGCRKCKIGNGTSKFSELPYIDSELQAYLLDRIEAISLELKTDLLNTKSELVAEITSNSTNTNDSILARLENVTHDYVSRDANLASNLNKDIIAVKQLIQNKIADLESRSNNTVEETKVNFQEKINLLKSDINTINTSLLNAINQLDQQNIENIAEVSNQIKDLETTAKNLHDTDSSLFSVISTANDRIITLNKELTKSIDNLKQSQIVEFTCITDELDALSKAQEVEGSAYTNLLLEYIQRFYAELADLVDDDVMILNLVYTFKNNLSWSINNLDKKLSAKIAAMENNSSEEDLAILNEALETAKQELSENIDSAVGALTENIETLRSTVNIKFSDIVKDIADIKKLISEDELTTQNKFNEIDELFGQIDGQFSEVTDTLNENINTVNSRIDNTNNELKTQSTRINNLISLQDGSTTGDAELIDIRSGYDGQLYESAGDAVRAVGNSLEALKNSLPDYIPNNAVDGLLYENNKLSLTSKGEPIGESVEITGGGGAASISTVKVTNKLASNNFTVAKDSQVNIIFTYTSFENEAPTGDGTYDIFINNKKIDALSGIAKHGEETSCDISEYLKNSNNEILIICTDQYGTKGKLYYKISVVDLQISSSFNSSVVFEDSIVFRFKIFGQVEKTVYVLLDNKPFFTRTLNASVSGVEMPVNIPKQTHGCHKLLVYATANINGETIPSNTLQYELLCIEANKSEAIITSICDTETAIQGDLITIPYMVYDPAVIECPVELIIYSQVGGQLVEISRDTRNASRDLQLWKTRKYPIGNTVFTISYTYSLHGVSKTITKSHTILVNPLDVDVSIEEDDLQLHLTAQGRANNEQNPGIWTFNSSNPSEPEITTTFTNMNWVSNGWITDENGDTCLRLNGDARAIINFKPFEKDFKPTGKTLEFDFAIRDVNNRNAKVIDCYNEDDQRGFRATPDMAFLQSSGTKVSCRYKDRERTHVAISVEHADSISCFVAIYLDGVLSGIQRYTTDNFAQNVPLNITLGSNLCGVDIYSIRVYNKALSAPQLLRNYIADLAEPNTKLELVANNDILDANGKISYDRVKALGKIPIITFTGQMPAFKGDKKKDSVRMKFEDPVHPELNFDVLLKQIDVQGTSSAAYVRKNWKVKLPEAHAHIPGAIPAKVFCIKVDYAEATGTHNTGSANYIETLYDKNTAIIPPQKDDSRIRTTVQGFPCILFEKATEDSEPVFSSKGNFNYDKGAENTFGFTEAYSEAFGVESWEFCNNTSDAVNFTGIIPENWLDDFEPRYVPESANLDRLEELAELAEAAANDKATMTSAQEQEFSMLLNNCIANFKEVHDWVRSTATYTLSDGKRVPIEPSPLEQPVIFDGITYTEDNEEYRLAKFKNEFTDHFNLHYAGIYYVFTFFALMTDQRSKNMFLTRWKDDDGIYRWYPYFYDNDTIFGINNEGALVFDYYHEDTDRLGSSNVFNGRNNVLWENFRICFPQEIQKTYASLRSDKKLTYEAIIDRYITQGSDKWSETIYNEDADYKYITMAKPHNDANGNTIIDASNLYQVRGTGEQHLKYFIANRLNYCDSKWYAGEYPSNYFFLRINTPTLEEITDDMSEADKTAKEKLNAKITASLKAVPANPNISVTTFSDMYAGLRYKAGSRLQQQRVSAGSSCSFSPLDPNDTFNDTETMIYGASEISSLGDLSSLYCSVINLAGQDTSNASASQGHVKENKLTELILGNANPNYYNDNFREVYVGTCRLLKTIDLRNCYGLGIAGTSPQKTLDLSGCPNIENIYTEGTNLNYVNLPESGYIKKLHLPASVNTIVIKNQKYISDFLVESYDNIKTLFIENCPTINSDDILSACRQDNGKYSVERVHLTGIDWSFQDAEFIKNLFPRFDAEGKIIGGIRGIDSNNNNTDDAYLVGTCYIEHLTGAEYTEIKAHYPYLDIKFGEMSSTVTFVYNDIQGQEHTHTVTIVGHNSEKGQCDEPILDPIPAWPENEAFTYEHVGWSKNIKQVSNGLDDNENDYLNYLHADALTNIAGDRTLYPVFKANRKSYQVQFINPTDNGKVLQVVMVPYGSDANYTEQLPEKKDTPSPDLYTFTAWYPSPENITKATDCYAQFIVLDDKWYTINILDVSDCEDINGNIFDGYSLDTSNHTINITNCKNKFNKAVRIPNTFDIENNNYLLAKLGGFSNHTQLELISLPDTLTEISARGFYNCYNMSEVTFSENLQVIGKSAFQNCSKIQIFNIPIGVHTIGEAAFADCKNLTVITVDPENTRYKVINDCLIDTQDKKLIQGLSTSIIPQDNSITCLGQYCFSNTQVNSISIPEGLTAIANNAFSRCTALTEVTLPSTLISLDATCFAWCLNLANIDLPEGLRYIYTFVFDSCALKDIVIPSTVETILERAFGDMPTLETVTFKKRLDEDGNIIVPNINEKAFAGSGSTDHTLTFNLPWSSDKTPLAPWGATNCELNFDYNEDE